MMNLRDNQSGNTLANLIIGMTVITLLATISIPYIRKYQPNLKLNSTARDLVSDLRYAQQLTVTEQVVHYVQMDLGTDSYEIIKNSATPVMVKNVNFNSEVRFQQITDLTDNKVVFNSYGGVSESGQIILTNTNNKTATINVKPSGYIQLAQ